jgi:hypothetical protein
MLPWFWLNWAPRYDFPLSGNVSQDVDTDWFFDAINSQAGDGGIEKEVFKNASYGKQIGLLTDVLLSLIDNESVDKARAEKSLHKLKALYKEVELIKARHAQASVDDAVKVLEQLRDSSPEKFNSIMSRLA